MSDPPRKRGGRNGSEKIFTEELLEEILERLAGGESLNVICHDAHMPTDQAVRKWGVERLDIGSRIARARAAGLDHLADEVISIGDASIMFGGEPNNALVQQARLACDNRKWLLSKLLPHQYGDKVTQEIVGDADRPLVTRIELVPVEPVVRAVTAQPKLPKPD